MYNTMVLGTGSKWAYLRLWDPDPQPHKIRTLRPLHESTKLLHLYLGQLQQRTNEEHNILFKTGTYLNLKMSHSPLLHPYFQCWPLSPLPAQHIPPPGILGQSLFLHNRTQNSLHFGCGFWPWHVAAIAINSRMEIYPPIVGIYYRRRDKITMRWTRTVSTRMWSYTDCLVKYDTSNTNTVIKTHRHVISKKNLFFNPSLEIP